MSNLPSTPSISMLAFLTKEGQTGVSDVTNFENSFLKDTFPDIAHP